MDLADDRIRADRFGLSLALKLSEILEDEEPLQQVLRALAHHDLAWLGKPQEPRGEVRGVPDRRVVHAEVLADGADPDETRVDSHPHAKLHAVEPPHVCGEWLKVLL